MADEPTLDRASLEAERARLVSKANARRNQPGFAANVQAIDERVAAIDVLLGAA